MNKCQLSGVQGLSRRGAHVPVRRLPDGVRIELFTAQGMADFRKVDANLVRAARFEAAFDDGVAPKVLDRADMRDSSLCAFRFFAQWRAAT